MLSDGEALIVDWGHAQLLLPAEGEASRSSGGVVLRVLLEDFHLSLFSLHDCPGLIRTLRRAVATRLAREASIGVGHGALVVTLERVEVFVVARSLWVPSSEDSLLGFKSPNVVKLTNVVHLRSLRTDLNLWLDGGRHEALGGDERNCSRDLHSLAHTLVTAAHGRPSRTAPLTQCGEPE